MTQNAGSSARSDSITVQQSLRIQDRRERERLFGRLLGQPARQESEPAAAANRSPSVAGAISRPM
jgi:hypothetical protein